MATPNPQSGGNSCTLPSTVGFALKVETNLFFFPANSAGLNVRVEGGPVVS